MNTANDSTYTEQKQSAKPAPLLDPIPENIPEALRRFKDRWGLWEAKWNPAKKGGKGGWDKRPVALDGRTGRGANVKWNSFADARNAWEIQSLVSALSIGLGFTLTNCHKLTILDLDDCVSPQGEVEPWAQTIIDNAGTYAERSPSGTGIRIAGFGRAAVDWTNHERGIEVYAGHAPRFLTMTGHRLAGSPDDLQPFPDGFLEALYLEHKGQRSSSSSSSSSSAEREPPPDMPELLEVGDLPRLEDLSLPTHALAYLTRGECGHGDGSRAVAGAAIALLEATATPEGLLQPDVVLTLLADNPHAWEVATRHWEGGDDRALMYLWKHHVVRGVAKAKPAILGFDNLDGKGEEAGGEGGTPPRSGLETFAASSLHGKPVPARSWLVPRMVPAKTVTLLSGDGGTGKSLLALQLGTAVAIGGAWLGNNCQVGPVLYLAAEDDTDEVHRRLAAICASDMMTLEDLAALHVAPLAGRDAVLAEATARGGKLEATALWKAARARVAELRPALVIFDTLADLFAANENDRSLAQQFIALLRGLCTDFGTTVLLLSHPSKAGLGDDSGTSGSTAWNNSVRSRLYLKRPKEEKADTPLRVLEVMKSNYGGKGDTLTLFWRNGVFTVRDEADKTADAEGRAASVREAFFQAFEAKEKAGLKLSPHEKGSSFAPKVIAEELRAARPGEATYSKAELSVAMTELLTLGVLEIVTEGPPSKRRERLARGPTPMPKPDL